MIGWNKKHSYWALAIAVLIVAVVAIGAYAWYFRKMEIVTDTEKWADFATYLSGTVGVAAVVATLFAFVKTLGQQQYLINSQAEMLKKQKKQIKISKKQLKSEEKRRVIELAHSSAVKVFPILIERFKNDLNSPLVFYTNEEEVMKAVGDKLSIFEVKTGDLLFNSPALLDVFESSDEEVVRDIVNRVFSCADKVYFFSSSHLKITLDLTEFFYIYMHEDLLQNRECRECLICYHAFLMGLGENKYCKLGVKYLNLPSSYDNAADYYLNWFKIGQRLKRSDR